MHKKLFILPKNQVYLCGHSLGPMPIASQEKIAECLHDWGTYGVQSWTKNNWIDLPMMLAQKISGLLGVNADEITLSDSTSVNLYKIMLSAQRLNAKRHIILSDKENFPADLYIAQGITQFKTDLLFETVSEDLITETLADANKASAISVLILSHVNYRHAGTYAMQAITKQAHQAGILVIWDLSHSIGAMPINLSEINADFAVGCTYKYLSGGPGAPAFIYANKKHHANMLSPICGWMGHQQPFEFMPDYHGKKNAAIFTTGTPYILSLKALEGALSVFDNLSLSAVYQQTLCFSDLMIQGLINLGLTCLTPSDTLRGAHVAFKHRDGYAISRALIDKGFICDYREPGLIRFCVNALYLSQAEIQACLDCLQEILTLKLYHKIQYQQKLKVT